VETVKPELRKDGIMEWRVTDWNDGKMEYWNTVY
jgi:hypothetical protein